VTTPPPDRLANLAAGVRSRVAELERARRSPLCIELMRGAAASAETGGIVAELFDGDPLLPGSVPELRLLAALHHLVLSGQAPQLAHHYPSAGGTASPAGAWAAAEHALTDNRDLVAARIDRTVQTNEPGRCVSLLGGLLWLAERHRRPIRLLEIGASAGLNLNADRYRYVVGGETLGDPDCELAFVEPWVGLPVADPAGAHAQLNVSERAGCDAAPIDPTSDEGRLSLLSYIWPDEPDRLARVAVASRIAAMHPVPIERSGAADWLRRHLTPAPDGVLTVVWQSVVDQYLDAAERSAIDANIRRAAETIALAWLTLEPGSDTSDGFELRCWEPPREQPLLLAIGGYHGPPVRWRPELVVR
jgi:hypothetical protein